MQQEHLKNQHVWLAKFATSHIHCVTCGATEIQAAHTVQTVVTVTMLVF